MYHMGLSFRSVADYVRGLRSLREILGIGRAREAMHALPGSELICLRLHGAAGAVTLLIRVRDVYVVGVQNDNGGFYFNDFQGRMIGNQALLGFSGHYTDLGKFESLGALGKGRFEAAVDAVSCWTTASPPTSITRDRGKSADARHLLALILATAEAARFLEIGTTIANALYNRRDRPLTLKQIDELVHQWSYLSGKSFPVQVAVPLIKA